MLGGAGVSLRERLERRAGGPARLYDGALGWLDRRGLAAAREALVRDLDGDVVEVGCGTGATFAHYPAGARVRAVEPEPDFRRAAALAARGATGTVDVLPGEAERLPFPDGAFDAAVASLVLCSVAEPGAALRELRRVLRPGGRLRLLEHVRHPSAWVGRVQDALDPAWTALEGRGCHIGRDTPAVVRGAGFEVEEERGLRLPPVAGHLFPLVLVRGRKPG